VQKRTLPDFRLADYPGVANRPSAGSIAERGYETVEGGRMGWNELTSSAWVVFAVAVLPVATRAQRPPPSNTVSINVTVVSAVTRAPVGGAILI
jgi:hypothetical protein